MIPATNDRETDDKIIVNNVLLRQYSTCEIQDNFIRIIISHLYRTELIVQI